ncbi:immunoglobulin-like and fibronectin type III domain-containing protein 1-like, partial [Scleropages formosus]
SRSGACSRHPEAELRPAGWGHVPLPRATWGLVTGPDFITASKRRESAESSTTADMWKKGELTDELATEQGPEQGKPNKRKVSIRKKSKVPGVIVTQFVEELPEGKSTPDFIRKPITLTIQEGKFAFFKAVVTGDPKPQVTWTRAKREMLDLEKFQNKYNSITGEYILEIHKVCGEDADTYKCFAVNEFGKAVCTATLNVIEGLTNDLAEFRKMLRKRAVCEKPEKKQAGVDDKFWEVLLSAEKKDYERICAEHGVTDFRWMLRKLGEMRQHREEEQSKDDVMIPYSEDMDMKHNLEQVDKNLIFTIDDLRPEDVGLYQADAEEVNVFSTEFKIDFVIRIQEVKAKEGEDAVFQCVLSHPLPKVIWMGKNTILENGKKYRITVSQDNLTHQLVVKNCLSLDKGIYSVVAGIKTCSAWLLVEAGIDPSMYGKKKVRKTTQAGSAEVNLEAVAKKQQANFQKEKEEMPEAGDKRKEPGVRISCGLSDVNISTGQPAELTCKLSSPKISSCQEVHAGMYRFEGDGCTAEALVTVQDPPKFNPNDLDRFLQPIVIKAGQSATFRIPFSGQDLKRVQWYGDGEELLDEPNVQLEKTPNQSCLHLNKCQRKDGGEIKLRVKNECSVVEAISRLIVLDKPTNPQGPIEVLENSASCIEIKWKPPKDDGGSPLKGYVLERQQVGRNTWKKLGSMVTVPIYRDTDVDHGKKYRYRIRAVNEEGESEVTETDDLMAGTKGPPDAPKVVSAFKDCVNLSWTVPANTGGSCIVGYNLEKRRKGSNLWIPVNPVEEPIKDRKYAVKDIIAGMEYEFRVVAVSVSGPGEPSVPSEFVCARDPKTLPGKVRDLRVTDFTSTTLSLTWSKPAVEEGFQDEANGYFVEVWSVESSSWERYNSNPITMTSFVVKGLNSMNMYWVRVIATNEAGEGEPHGLDICTKAMPPPVRPKFITANMKTFMAVKAGNSVRVSVNFDASPLPDVIWLKDNVPVSKRVTISTADGASQLLIPTSKYSDTGVYTVTIKNLVGQETFSTEIRITDDPKPPGPVDLEENVPGTVTVTWEPSPDEKHDDRLHYMVSKWDSSKGTWHTVADGLFNNKFTVCSLIPGHEYQFRVYAKNDIGLSAPSESLAWVTTRKKVKFMVNVRKRGACSLCSVPTFLVPLKDHVAQPGYECRMSCAVGGHPAPRVTWQHGDVSLHGDADYYISNTCGVCSMAILRVGPGDAGMYTVTAENAAGRAECSARLTV